MFKKVIVVFFILVSGLSRAQTTYFKSIGGGFNPEPLTLVVDSIKHKIYTCGSFTKIKETNMSVKFAAVWDGVKWDSIRHIIGDSVSDIVNINNILYGVGDVLSRENPTTHVWEVIARPNKTNYAAFARLCKFGNDLIIYGSQDSINGQKVSQIVKYDGTNFTSLGTTNFSGNFMMQEYQGELYIGGAFTESNYGLTNLAKWNGTAWVSIPWTSGCSFCSVGKMIIYQNKLFIGGRFSKSSGQVADDLLSWDGTNLIDYNLVGSSVESVWDMCIYKNKLIITGFMDANVPLSNQQFTGFLSYDGQDMCSYVPYYDNLQKYRLRQANVFNDTLIFLSTRTMSPTDTVNYICKFVGDINNPLYCSSGVGLKENNAVNETIKIYPNPTTSILNILDEYNQLQNATIQIKNYLGQVVFTSSYKNQIDLSHLSSSIYFLFIHGKESEMTWKIIKE